MENNLETTNAINSLSAQTNDSELVRIGTSDYIPLLTLAYSLSESVDKGIARPGEFVLAKTTSLGSELECVPLAYRLHAALINVETFSFVESQYVQMGEATPQSYKEFVTMNAPTGHEVQEGADLFLFIPKIDSFAQIFMKKTLGKAVQPIWSAGKGGRLVKLVTKQEKNRAGSRKWYTITPFATQRALEISKLEGVTKDVKMDINLFTKYNNQFRNPPKSAAENAGEVKDEASIER